jgi:hypothetical protein
MKKIFTLALLAVASLSAGAQEYNLFNAADVDADGWLWFNTQEKIDKYVGTFDEDNYTVNPNGKLIQMGFANITPDYPETVADPDVTGADSQGYLFADEGVNKDELIKGAIILAPASAQSSMNGGCLILNLPSCATINLLLSSEARMMGRTLMVSPGFDMSQDDSTGDDPWTGHTKAIYAKASVFGSIHGAGQYKWEGIESLNNGYNEGVSFVSDGPVYFALQNCHKYPIYVHAIKVTTPKQESAGVRVLSADAAAKAPVYNLAGQRTAAPAQGLFIQGGKKLVIK